MKKTLKYQVKKVDMDGVHFVITEQSHRCDVFGAKDEEFVASNGVTISSNDFPEFGISGTLFVRGSKREYDNHTIVVPYEHVKKMFQAIEEYNKFEFPDKSEEVIKQFNVLMDQLEKINNEISKFMKENTNQSEKLLDVFMKRFESAIEKLYNRK